MYAPFGIAEFNILFKDVNGGIDKYGSLLDAGNKEGMFGSSAGWFEIEGKKLRRADAIKLLEDNPDKYEVLRDTYMSI
ncbi:recombinase A [compost metagenome]